MKEKTFEFSLEGLAQAKAYNARKEFIENHPELLLVGATAVVLIGVVICNPLATTVAYKTMLGETAKIAFKYLTC